jgi:hypothetical protein
MSAVDMFSSLHAKLVYNSILISAIDFTISTSIAMKVYFIPGCQNTIADYLSRSLNAHALQLAPKHILNPLGMCWG